MIPVGKINPAPYNPRRDLHPGDPEFEKIRRSLDAFGLVEPLVWNKRTGHLVGGHQRLKVLVASGKTVVPCSVVDLAPEQEMALNVALNKVGGGWDEALLADLLQDLRTYGTDLTLTGFDGQELYDLLQAAEAQFPTLDGGGGAPPSDSEAPSSHDDAPAWGDVLPTEFEPPADLMEDAAGTSPAITQPGDLWLLGPHRLVCGDCRNGRVVDILFAGAKAALVVTSPPYASQRAYDENSEFKPIRPDEYVDWYRDVAANIMAHLSDDGNYILNIKEHSEGGERHLYVKDLHATHVRAWGWKWRDEYAWLRAGMPGDAEHMGRFKNGFEPVFWYAKHVHSTFLPRQVMHESDSAFNYEAMVAAGKRFVLSDATQGRGDNDPVGRGPGKAYPSNVLHFKQNPERMGHPAAYPLVLPTFFIHAHTVPDDVVYDPFMGTGTTLMAADHAKRVGYGCEVSPRYCDLIVRRWETATGRKAERIPQGVSHDGAGHLSRAD